jgi:hypothetical protein
MRHDARGPCQEVWVRRESGTPPVRGRRLTM